MDQKHRYRFDHEGRRTVDEHLVLGRSRHRAACLYPGGRRTDDLCHHALDLSRGLCIVGLEIWNGGLVTVAVIVTLIESGTLCDLHGPCRVGVCRGRWCRGDLSRSTFDDCQGGDYVWSQPWWRLCRILAAVLGTILLVMMWC